VLRIEDTDRERSVPENVDQILDALRWLELDWDEGPLSQYERRERHRERIGELLASGHAYPDDASAADVRAWKEAHGGAGYRGEPREGPGAAIRLRVPDEGATVVEDLIRGPVRFENRTQDDFVVARGDGTPLYNLAVAVDDADMAITDVVRGDDHLSNTPKQLLVLEALGAAPPRYAHLPLLHGPDGRKLSKRDRAASVQELRDLGYLPEAVRNYLALLGWGTEDDSTILRTNALVARF
jgi:glutamyl-tRNA synthetase